jgi:DNA-binding response OmpR family regulator
VISDVVMPRMSGPSLVATLRNRWPRLQALLTSGYESEEVAGLAREDAGMDFLQKPFTLADLVSRVQALLARSAGGAGPSTPRST